MGSHGVTQVCEWGLQIEPASIFISLRYASSRTSSHRPIRSSSPRLPIGHRLRTWKKVCARFVDARKVPLKALTALISSQLHQCILSASSVAIKNEPSAEQVKRVQNLQRAEKARRRVEKDRRSQVKKSRKGSGGGAWD